MLHGLEGKDQAPQPEECVPLGPGTVWSSMKVHSANLWSGIGQPQDNQSLQLLPLLIPQSGSTSVGTELLSVSGVLMLTWHFWHSAEFEVAHIGTEGEAVGPCEDGHSRTKLSMEDPGI